MQQDKKIAIIVHFMDTLIDERNSVDTQ
jgi:hypothetical protein